MFASKPCYDQLLELGWQQERGPGEERVFLGGDGWDLNLG